MKKSIIAIGVGVMTLPTLAQAETNNNQVVTVTAPVITGSIINNTRVDGDFSASANVGIAQANLDGVVVGGKTISQQDVTTTGPAIVLVGQGSIKAEDVTISAGGATTSFTATNSGAAVNSTQKINNDGITNSAVVLELNVDNYQQNTVGSAFASDIEQTGNFASIKTQSRVKQQGDVTSLTTLSGRVGNDLGVVTLAISGSNKAELNNGGNVKTLVNTGTPTQAGDVNQTVSTNGIRVLDNVQLISGLQNIQTNIENKGVNKLNLDAKANLATDGTQDSTQLVDLGNAIIGGDLTTRSALLVNSANIESANGNIEVDNTLSSNGNSLAAINLDNSRVGSVNVSGYGSLDSTAIEGSTLSNVNLSSNVTHTGITAVGVNASGLNSNGDVSISAAGAISVKTVDNL